MLVFSRSIAQLQAGSALPVAASRPAQTAASATAGSWTSKYPGTGSLGFGSRGTRRVGEARCGDIGGEGSCAAEEDADGAALGAPAGGAAPLGCVCEARARMNEQGSQ